MVLCIHPVEALHSDGLLVTRFLRSSQEFTRTDSDFSDCLGGSDLMLGGEVALGSRFKGHKGIFKDSRSQAE